MQISIEYVKKEKLSPRFGLADYDTNTAKVREDLPQKAKDYLLVHEIYHLHDRPGRTFWKIVWGEVKANCSAAHQEPIGFIIVLYLSLFTKERIKFYWNKYILRKKGEYDAN